MVILDPEPTFWSLVSRLREFERWSVLWRLPIAALAYAIAPLASVIAAVLVAYIASGGFNLTTAAIASVVGLAANRLISPRLDRLQLHRGIIAKRLRSYQTMNPAAEVQILVRRADLDAARTALRRAKFHPWDYSLDLGSPPADAPHLTCKFSAYEPDAWQQSASDEDRTRRMRNVLEAAGIHGRVGGLEALPGGERTTDADGRRTGDGRGVPASRLRA